MPFREKGHVDWLCRAKAITVMHAAGPLGHMWLLALLPHGHVLVACTAPPQVVVHCWGGGGRTGVALAAWLVRHHKLAPEQASRDKHVHHA